MPELPEVETLAAQLHQKVSGLVLSKILIHNDSILETPKELFQQKCPGKKVDAVLRRGKFLKMELEEKTVLWFHLGMTGQLLWSQKSLEPDPHTHVVIQFEKNNESLFFRDIRKFGSLCLTNGKPEALPEGIRLLGPEPFDLSDDVFINLFKMRKGRIKTLLLNQRLMAGLGNIYADESLHRAGIDPRRRPSRLNRAKLRQLHRAICETLEEAIRQGGSSIDDYLHTDGERGSFQNFHRVYGRAGAKCFRCETPIRRIRLAGRSACFCPKCQK